MVVEPVAALTFDLGASDPADAATPGGQVSTFDLAHFEQAYRAGSITEMESAVQASSPSTEVSGFETALKALESLNSGVNGIGVDALRVAADKKELTPSEMLSITVQAHHFLFQSELTANVANRSSEGIQQLFRQQS